ncbi:MAG: nuclear transport factor 2 family protein [Mariniphaga sp.]
MKTVNFVILVLLLGIFGSCQTSKNPSDAERYKSELFAIEKEFCAMAQSDGVQKAFVYFAADSAAVQRKGQILKGKENISKQYASFPKNDKLEWSPDFVDVSASGDLGYTYGKYTYTVLDSLGRATQSTGIFHTVWKRQADGKWRFVWD